ncbi:hypothetical protein O6H91_13G068400 [Diphasiastrum complanatum]|uniref:Uncharacterized protein n=1 Tax=Diphasiastrum complanatum TaxID=34168 RepID=A0ACC2BVQ7_DIPCM|nr:hypothetical protein O6H91_13G068400 [Diphasiastrum complanatum]
MAGRGLTSHTISHAYHVDCTGQWEARRPGVHKPVVSGGEKKVNYTTVVEGYVYCHDCPSAGGKWIKSLSGALVSVLCKDKAGVVKSYGAAKTDNVGFYQIKLPEHNPLVLGTHLCKAHLVVSSDDSCNVITNAGNGKSGADLILRKEYLGEIFFKVAPLACTPYYCDHRGVKY